MGWGRFFRRAKWDRERLEEIESYVQIEMDDNIARGMPHAEARAAARRKFGNSTLIREEIYSMNTIAFFDTLSRDVRYGLRALRHNPVFTVVALLTIAIGIGANTAVFSVVNSVLLKPLPYPKSEELVALRQAGSGRRGPGQLFRRPASLALHVFHLRGAQPNFPIVGRVDHRLGERHRLGRARTGPHRSGQRRRASGAQRSARGRPLALSRRPDSRAARETVMLSYGYWQRRFGGERSVIGRNIRWIRALGKSSA